MGQVLSKETESEINKFIDERSVEILKKLPVPHPLLELSVIIPAKNEEENIENTLHQFLYQKEAGNSFFDKNKFEILVCAHNSCDRTEERCLEFFKKYPEVRGFVFPLHSELANTVGAARRLLMNIASGRLPSQNNFIVSTDADTIPDPCWLAAISNFGNSNVSLICGKIETNLSQLSGQALRYQTFKEKYVSLKSHLEAILYPQIHDSWPRHGYHWGPSLAITKKAYEAIGKIRPLHFLEDVDLYNRVVAAGMLAKHPLNVKVTTSTRTDARCLEGFGAELEVWKNNADIPYEVEGYPKLHCRFQLYQLTKEYYKNQSKIVFLKMKNLSGFSFAELDKVVNEHSFQAGVFRMERTLNQNAEWHARYPNTPVEKACLDIESYLETIESSFKNSIVFKKKYS